MLLGITFLSERAFLVRDNTYINTRVELNGNEIDGSIGMDIFRVNGAVVQGKNYGGLGRERTYNSISAPSFNGEPSKLIDLTKYSPGDAVKIIIQTNVFLDPGLFVHHSAIRIFDQNNNFIETPLAVPDLPIYWPQRGTFHLDITDLVERFYKKYIPLKEAVN